MPTVPDGELLRRFVLGRDEAAFELLVWRHGPLVAGVCRRVLRHRQDAEDAAQAAFLVFARRADTVRGSVAGWLARVAYRCALKLVNRRVVEHRSGDRCHQTYSSGGTDLLTDVAEQHDLSAHLDTELNRLPDRYRLPLVLCCLRGLSYQQAAAELNCKPGTVSGRLSRAKALLRARLTARGLAPTAAALAAMLAGLSESVAASHSLVRSVTTAALSATPPGRVDGVASGVCRMMALKSLVRKSAALLTALAVVFTGTVSVARLPADDPKTPQPAARPRAKPFTDLDRLRDDWVFESAEAIGGSNGIHQGWRSVVTFAGEYVTVSKYLGLDYSTKYTIDETKSPKQFDLTINELAKKVLKFQDGTIKGIYKIDGDTLEMCLAGSPDAPRPTEFTAGPGLNQFRFTLKRKKMGFHPDDVKEFRVTVVDPDGRPVEGATVSETAFRSFDPEKGRLEDWYGSVGNEQPPRTTAKGELTYSAERPPAVLYVRHEGRKLVAMEPVSPARIMAGVTITLRPEAKLSGKVVFADGTDPGPTQVYLCNRNTLYVLGCFAPDGRFEFAVPPGDYRLLVRGEYVSEEFAKGASSFPSLGNTVEVTVGPEGKEMKLEVKPNPVGALRGKPAPALGEMAAWKGDAVKLADLKGKVVLVQFFTAGPNTNIVYAMPSLVEHHTNYAAEGLVVVGVHVSGAYDEPVTTVKEFDKRIDTIRTDKWLKGDIPFPVGLTAKRDDPAAKAYGLPSEAVLIDRKGNVVGFHRPYVVADMTRLEKLLKAK
jgi:RNA polymerase sigma factor (sigma-70 family)